MKFMRQFGLILFVTFLGEGLKAILPFPIPASIYGLVIMLVALKTGVISIDSVRDVGGFLIEIMPLMFIPAAVGLLESWGVLKPIFLPVSIITVVSTVLVMVVSGWVTQWIIRLEKRKKNERTTM